MNKGSDGQGSWGNTWSKAIIGYFLNIGVHKTCKKANALYGTPKKKNVQDVQFLRFI